MYADLHAALCEPVTVVHRTEGAEDRWYATTYPECMWRSLRSATVDALGGVLAPDAVRVQIPRDQGPVTASVGDYVVRGAFAADGMTRSQLVAALPDSARTVRAIRDLAPSGVVATGDPGRFATATYLEAS